MELEIRTARAADQGPIAALMYSSGPHVYDYLYGKRATDFLLHEFASGRGFAGHPFVTVAVLDGKVVATGCFYDREIYREHTSGSVKNTLRHFGLLGGVPIMVRARHLSSVMRRPKPGELYLSNFGVAPELQGQGIGSKLIRHKLAEARSKGYRLFGLDVAATNPRAEALYARLGLTFKKQKRFSDPRAAMPDARKMELVL